MGKEKQNKNTFYKSDMQSQTPIAEFRASPISAGQTVVSCRAVPCCDFFDLCPALSPIDPRILKRCVS